MIILNEWVESDLTRHPCSLTFIICSFTQLRTTGNSLSGNHASLRLFRHDEQNLIMFGFYEEVYFFKQK